MPRRRYNKAPYGSRPSARKDKESLRKQVLLRCHRAQQRNSTRFENGHGQRSAKPRAMDLQPFSVHNVKAVSPATPRRFRTHLPVAQRVIQSRMDELKQCMRNIHVNAWSLRHAAILRRCPASYNGNPKAYFAHKLWYLLWYKHRHVSDWETELHTLLGAVRAPLWDQKYWHNSLSLILDSIHVVIEAM
ncbi:hypothetical protein B0H12DRAFT_1101247 [Mycena haematopus]|nr:hypothetical protein B0H12DRAFT_1101247 [Mycena haematopus]